MSVAGITGYGAYVPRLRLDRKAVAEANAWFAPGRAGKVRGSRSMANWDEDSVTMAVAAARDCLGRGDDRGRIGSVYFCSTTAPFAERLNAGIVAGALTLDREIEAHDLAGSRRSALSALALALSRSAATGHDGLIIAADLRNARPASGAELKFGDAAAAVTVGNDRIIAACLATASVTVDFIDRFRNAGEPFSYEWEERWVRDEGISKLVPEAVSRALVKAGLDAGSVDHFIFPTNFARLDGQIAKLCGIDPGSVVPNLTQDIGETGTPHALLLLADVLARAVAGAVIVVADFANGAEAVVLRATDHIAEFRPQRGVSGWLDRGRPETSYAKLLAFRGLVEIERGMRGEQDRKTALSTYYRHQDAILGFVGGKCRESGSVHFPPSRLSYDPQGPLLDTQDPHKMAELYGKVLSWSAESLSFYMAPPHQYGQVDFNGGGRVLMEFTDVAQGDIDTGTDVEMTFRIKDRDMARGFTRYFWKATPAAVEAVPVGTASGE